MTLIESSPEWKNLPPSGIQQNRHVLVGIEAFVRDNDAVPASSGVYVIHERHLQLSFVIFCLSSFK